MQKIYQYKSTNIPENWEKVKDNQSNLQNEKAKLKGSVHYHVIGFIITKTWL